MAPVDQKVDGVIHWITQLVFVTLIQWIAIYMVDSDIQFLNNPGQMLRRNGPSLSFLKLLFQSADKCH